MQPLGGAKFGWFKIVNISARNCRCSDSRKGKSRWTAKSHCAAPNALRKFLGALPCRRGVNPVLGSVGGSVNAAGLKAFPPGYCDPNRYNGRAGTTSGRTFPKVKSENRSKKFPSVRSTGGAERARKRFSTDHPRTIAPANRFTLGVGMSYVTAAEKAWRMSRTTFPLLK